MTAVFWILLGLCFLGMLLIVGKGAGSGPDGGMVGAWLLVIPAIVFAGIAVLFMSTNNDGVRAVCISVVAMPLLGAAVVVVVEPIQKRMEWNRYERVASGADIFREPAQMRLAQALRAGDVEKVKEFLPAAGDINKVYGETTFLVYALERGQGSEENRREILKTLLAAGANPNLPPGKPLRAVEYRLPGGVELLVEAGADVNFAEEGGEPHWWKWLDDDEYAEMVKYVVAHGANLQSRARGIGPVSKAAFRGSWKIMLLLMEAGAPYKGEKMEFEGDGTLYEHARLEAELKRNLGGEPAPELLQVIAMLEAAQE